MKAQSKDMMAHGSVMIMSNKVHRYGSKFASFHEPRSKLDILISYVNSVYSAFSVFRVRRHTPDTRYLVCTVEPSKRTPV